MCGFIGLLGSGESTHNNKYVLRNMADNLVTRGPDDFGIWVDESGIGLAHRRLSILDLSPMGHQPMVSICGRYLIVFNGEIYNHLEIRAELKKKITTISDTFHWRGQSDTETLLAAIAEWGIQTTLERCIGMFAFAVWDKKKQMLTLARDRLGEKPLYYGWQGQGESAVFLFGSELKALRAHPSFTAEIDRNSLCLLMRHNYIPAPHSIYKGISKLEAGNLLSLSRTDPSPRITQYWSLSQLVKAKKAKVFLSGPVQAVEELEVLLKDAVAKQMVSDVPLGAFLSGGVDSSTVVALMQAQTTTPIKTFTIGFNEAGYDEAVHAKAIANHLGTDHNELYITPQQALDVIPQLPRLYCEPFSDSSQIPTFLVAQLARQQVTVSLSGDAGDELFCGYNRYLLTNRLWNKLSILPTSIRQLAAHGITSVSPDSWNALLRPLQGFLPAGLQQDNFGDKLHKGAAVMTAPNIDVLYQRLVSHWDDPASIVKGGSEPPTLLTGNAPDLPGLNAIERMMALDTLTYLPDDILVKLDRAAMGVSLEGRVPFLDHRVVEFAWSLPQSMKLREGTSKWILREVLYRYVPKALIERPKMGFAVPIGEWLRGPLRDWAENLLDEGRLEREGFFYALPIRQKWAQHLSGQRNWQNHLWSVLMFQAWLEQEK